MNNKVKQAFEKADNQPVGFLIKGSPDPDAIGCCQGLLSYYQMLGGSGQIICDNQISLSNNNAMVNILGISMSRLSIEQINKQFNYYVIVDCPNPKIEGLDLSKCILHIDHHKESPHEQVKDVNQIIELDCGACSTIITKYLDEYFLSNDEDIEKVATALAYGIKSDTDNLDSCGSKDWEAMKILSEHYSKDLLKQIQKTKLSPQTIQILKKAFQTEKEEHNWLYANVGIVQEKYRDSISIVADELMRRAGIECVLVYGIIEREDKNLLVSASIRSIDNGFDLTSFVNNFSENSGGRRNKAGFQIPLDFWASCPDKEMLQNFVKMTIESKFKSILNAEKESK